MKIVLFKKCIFKIKFGLTFKEINKPIFSEFPSNNLQLSHSSFYQLKELLQGSKDLFVGIFSQVNFVRNGRIFKNLFDHIFRAEN